MYKKEEGGVYLLSYAYACVSENCANLFFLCGSPKLRSGLRLMINCIVNGDLESCPKGWHQENPIKCLKHISAENLDDVEPNDNSTGTAYKTCPCNPCGFFYIHTSGAYFWYAP